MKNREIARPILWILFNTLVFWACTKAQLDCRITAQKSLVGLPSASGIEIANGNNYVIGDDSPFLFLLDNKMQVLEKFQIHKAVTDTHGRIPKITKPDFEALARVEQAKDKFLLIFGSGSKSPQRDVLIKVNLLNNKTIHEVSMEAMYEVLKKQAGISNNELNIEGAATGTNHLILLNRGENLLFSYRLEDFLEYVDGKTNAIPLAKIHHFKLPEIDGIEAGFSGACFLAEENAIVFTASVENTKNWIDDGEILGSFVGKIPLNNLDKKTSPICTIVKEENGKAFKEKIESIVVKEKKTNGKYRAWAVTDNDAGDSMLLELEIGW